MKHKKNLLLIVALVVLLLAIGYALNKEQTKGVQMGTSYEDKEGWVYVCSQPIKVKDQGVKYHSGAPSLTPVNQSEANKYCHKTGIE